MTGRISQELSGPANDLVVVRHGVSWDDYEGLLAENPADGAPRLTYDRGTLEAVRFTSRQDFTNRTLAFIVNLVADALRVPIRDVGSTAFPRRDLLRGFNPDSGFYIQHAPDVSGKHHIELPADPPPDLLIDVTGMISMLDRLPLFAAFEVPEIWRYDETAGQATVLRLRHGAYHATRESAVLVPVTGDLLTRFVQESHAHPSGQWSHTLRSWIRTYD